jgi:FKBP-type peptidyl-prolyl cis-trans isomerase FkpA
MKFIKNYLVLALAGLSLASCDQFKMSQTESGLKYKFYTETEGGKKPKEGDFLEFQMIIANAADSVLRDSYKEGATMKMPLMKPQFKGSLEEGFALMSKGDSAVFYVSADSLFTRAQQQMPPGVKSGTDLKFTIKMLNIMSQKEYEDALVKEKAQFQTKMLAKQQNEPAAMAAYVAKNLKNPTKTPNGIVYSITTPGSGATVAAGDTVLVDYTGKLLDGKVFDSSVGAQPIGIVLLETPLIPAWNEMLVTMKKGESRTVVIPSAQGYGEQGSGGAIGPFETLVFDMKIVDHKPKKRK